MERELLLLMTTGEFIRVAPGKPQTKKEGKIMNNGVKRRFKRCLAVLFVPLLAVPMLWLLTGCGTDDWEVPEPEGPPPAEQPEPMF